MQRVVGAAYPGFDGDFDMLRAHQSGEPLSRVAWKQLAQDAACW